MYKELVTLLRKKYDKAPLVMEAADAIEEQSTQIKNWEDALKTVLDYIPCWIPVTERLPEEGEEVLCWICNDAMGDSYATVGHYDTTFRMWDLDSEYAMSRHVTHWMPIPMLPRTDY